MGDIGDTGAAVTYGAVYNDNEGSTGLYGAGNARGGSANSENVRGRGMLGPFTEEPEHALVPQGDLKVFDDTHDAHEELGGEYKKLNWPYSCEVYAATSQQSLHKPQQRPPSRFHTPKPVVKPPLPSIGAAYPVQFGQKLLPRVTEDVSRLTSVDEGSINPKWRTPALPAATAGKQPILKSIILQPGTERSPSPSGNSLWALNKSHRAEGARPIKPESAELDAPQNPPQQYMVSESAGQDPDDDPFGGNEPGKGSSQTPTQAREM
ncbi:hypothetical protein V496_02124 [Pseudogymnoascus sp. VKM F-4515 (FW-2607)]|nr:hypothetical protein V496_02124 [Pseudogymnoascus sp. VKM F-4515 (FW-2607)]